MTSDITKNTFSSSLLFGGTVPHFFYAGLDKIIPEGIVLRLLVERLLYTPLYQMLSLYMLARLEGKTHQQGCAQLIQLFWPVLKANWTYLTLIQYLNLRLVPPMVSRIVDIVNPLWYIYLLSHEIWNNSQHLIFLQLRVLVLNLVGFFWMITLAKIRSRQTQKKGSKSSETSKWTLVP